MAYKFESRAEGPIIDSDPPLPLDYISRMRPKVGLGLGGPIELPEEIRPKRYILAGPKKPKGYVRGAFGCLVNDEFKAIVEKHEPGVHGFLQAELVEGKTGEPYPETHHYFQCRTWLDAALPEKSFVEVKGLKEGDKKLSMWTVEDIPDLASYRLMSVGGYDKLFLDRTKTQGHAIWWDERLGEFFVSDELFAELNGSGLGGWYSTMERSPEI